MKAFIMMKSEWTLMQKKVKAIMNTCDTEWDIKIARVLLSANRSRSQIDNLGINSDNITADIAKVVEVPEEWKNANMAARDMVNLSLNERKMKISRTHKVKNRHNRM